MGTPTEIPRPELGEIRGGSLKIASIPAVFNYLGTNLIGISSIFVGGDSGFEAAQKDSRTLSKVLYWRGHIVVSSNTSIKRC